MNKKETEICDFLDEKFKDAECVLRFHNEFELLVAVMLSAQTTDIKVNNATFYLFRKYPTAKELSHARLDIVESIIRPLGLSKTKSERVIQLAKIIYNDYHNQVPSSKEELTKLPGVGKKTSEVVRAIAFNIPEFPVDTHVLRVTKRLQLVEEKATELTAGDTLKAIFPKDRWIKLHHQFIYFGRFICKAINPFCFECKLKHYCGYYKEKNKE